MQIDFVDEDEQVITSHLNAPTALQSEELKVENEKLALKSQQFEKEVAELKQKYSKLESQFQQKDEEC